MRDPVYCYVVRFCGDAVEAEDFTQEAFLRLYQHLREGHEVANVRSWVFQVARNLVISETRKAKLRQASPDLRVATEMPSLEPSSEDIVLKSERESELLEAVHSLTDLQQQCLHLRAEGLRYREIGEVLGLSVVSVADALKRGIRRMKERLDG